MIISGPRKCGSSTIPESAGRPPGNRALLFGPLILERQVLSWDPAPPELWPNFDGRLGQAAALV